MKHLRLIGVAAASAVVAIAAFAFTGDAQTAGRTIVLKEADKGSLFTIIDNPPLSKQGRDAPPAVTPGDQFVSAKRLLDPAGDRAGRIEAACGAVKPARALGAGAGYLCTGVAHLADGDLFLVARITPVDGPSDDRGVVTGGTGAYLGARGDFTMIGRPSTDTFNILP